MIKNIIQTPLEGVLIVENQKMCDSRGWFIQTYQTNDFIANGIYADFVQDNVSCSKMNVVRGLHYQLKYPQAKLVIVLKGAIWDVAVDIRKNSPTFGKWTGVELNEENNQMLYIPEGFAHGFLTLDDTNIVSYKVTDIYTPNDQYSVKWNDSNININWDEYCKVPDDILVSEVDNKAKLLSEISQELLPSL